MSFISNEPNLDNLSSNQSNQTNQSNQNIVIQSAPKPSDNLISLADHCPICLQALTSTNSSITPCNHFFHLSCILTWSIENIMENDNEPSCPVCRTALIKQQQHRHHHRQRGHRPYPPDTYPPDTQQVEVEEPEPPQEQTDEEDTARSDTSTPLEHYGVLEEMENDFSTYYNSEEDGDEP